jgi:hypothetical protein
MAGCKGKVLESRFKTRVVPGTGTGSASEMDHARIPTAGAPEPSKRKAIPMARVMVRAMTVTGQRTEPDMVHLLRDSCTLSLWSKAVLSALLFITSWVAPLYAVQTAHAEEEESVLLESGIQYPGGFDPNTVGKIEGKVSGYLKPDRGPVRFQVETGTETYTVLACPPWYWKDLGAEVSDGTQVWVHGSKSLGKDGKLYIIAQEIGFPSSGQSLVFRSEDGYPLWKGPKRGAMGRHRGFGSPQRGMGGMGGGGRMRRGSH